ncbi:MAG TPA: hypothetical protein ENI23_08185 [bacterium]|nr:hypothetical protein [bacterium]
MAKITIDLSGIGGLGPRFYGEKQRSTRINMKRIGKDTMYADGTVNPIRELGYLGPASNTTGAIASGPSAVIGSTITDLITVPGTPKGYFFERGTKLHELNSFTTVTLNTGDDFAHTISGATGTDLEIYTVNNVRKMFYSYQKSGGGNIGIWDFASTFDDDWLENAAASGFKTGATADVRMIVADNGFMYILDGASVHKIDGGATGGANGTATQNVLIFPSPFQCVDAIDLRGKMWIATIKSTTSIYQATASLGTVSNFCGVYIWDRKSTQVNFTDFIPIDAVREIRSIFVFGGVPHCFTISNANYTQLRRWNGTEFKVVRELPRNAFPEFHDSIHVAEEVVYWFGYDGKHYAYGKSDPLLDPAVYRIGDLTSHVTAEKTFTYGGAILGAEIADLQFITSIVDSGPNYLLKRWYPHSNTAIAAFPHTGNFYSLVKSIPPMSTVKSITLVWPKTASSASSTTELTAKLYFNGSATSWGSTTVTRNDGREGYKYIKVGERYVHSIQIELEYNPSSGLSDTNTIHPQYALIEYNTPKT